jgi:hypothetical protein
VLDPPVRVRFGERVGRTGRVVAGLALKKRPVVPGRRRSSQEAEPAGVGRVLGARVRRPCDVLPRQKSVAVSGRKGVPPRRCCRARRCCAGTSAV